MPPCLREARAESAPGWWGYVVAGAGPDQRQRMRTVVDAGEEVNARFGGEGGVGLAVGRDVDERGGAAPILVRPVREEQLGSDLRGTRSFEERGVDEREHVRRIEDVEERAAI